MEVIGTAVMNGPSWPLLLSLKALFRRRLHRHLSVHRIPMNSFALEKGDVTGSIS